MKHYHANKAMKRLVSKEANSAMKNMGIDDYTLSFAYHKNEKPKENDLVVAADITVNRRYLSAALNIYPAVTAMWKNKDYGAIADVVHHEIAHIHTQHLFDLATSIYKDEGETKDAWESLTQRIANLSLKIHNS